MVLDDIEPSGSVCRLSDVEGCFEPVPGGRIQAGAAQRLVMGIAAAGRDEVVPLDSVVDEAIVDGPAVGIPSFDSAERVTPGQRGRSVGVAERMREADQPHASERSAQPRSNEGTSRGT